MNEENSIPLEQIPEGELTFKSTISPEDAAKALAEVRGRSFSGRHPELGKMVNCPICDRRHRQMEGAKCEQVFTFRVGDYELYREDKDGNKVPAYRTAIDPDSKPTIKQILGAARLKGKRRNPSLSARANQLVQRTRAIFTRMGFELVDAQSEEFRALTPDEQKVVGEKFQKNLKTARTQALIELKQEIRDRRKVVHARQHTSRVINRATK